MAHFKAPLLHPDVEERVLQYLNSARTAEDLAGIDPTIAQRIFDTRATLGPDGFTNLEQLATIEGFTINLFQTHLLNACIGTWEVLTDAPVYVVHAAVLKTGKVLMYAGTAEESHPLDSAVWDPYTDTFTRQDNAYAHDLFCSHHVFLPDGKLLVNGGAVPGSARGITATYLFDPDAETWTPVANMNRPRWYPTTVASSIDQPVFTFSGLDASGGIVEEVESYQRASDAWQIVPDRLNTTLVTRVIAVSILIILILFLVLWLLFIPVVIPIIIALVITILVTIVTALVSRIPAGKNLEIYPGMHWMPSSRIFYTGTRWHSRSSLWNNPPSTALFHPLARLWTDVAAHLVSDRTEGMSVILPPDNNRVLIVGGRGNGRTSVSTDSVEIIDFNASNPTWTAASSMSFKRRNVNAVLLPTGRILVCSGIRGFKWDSDPQPVLAAEEYDPGSDAWTTLAEMTVPRLYHSVSLLLPDARVINLGSVMANGTDTLNKKVEVFSPPYLCRGPRPTITALQPQEVQYGSPFNIATPDATSIADGGEVVLVRPGAATHHTDSEQRVVPLVFTQDAKAGGLRATAPNPTQAPPGYYMLFLINGEGVPSIFLNEAGEPSPGNFIRLY